MELDYKEDIIATRVGGLGSSDAKMVAQVGRTGKINYAAAERIGQMLEQVERKQIKTKAMELGDNMENTIFCFISQKYPQAVSNPKVVDGELSEKSGFDVITHIDYEVETESELIWFECKATKGSTEETHVKYYDQLVWHWMLGRRKADTIGKVFHLNLVHYDTTDYSGEFDAAKLNLMNISEPALHYEQNILKGLDIIAKTVRDGFVFTPKEILEARDLPVHVQDACREMGEIVRQIELMEKQKKEFSEKMLQLMELHNFQGLICDYFTVSYRAESSRTTFDTKKFEKEHPELYAQYVKTGTVKSSVTIKSNNNQ